MKESLKFLSTRKFGMLLVPIFTAIAVYILLPEFGYILSPMERLTIFGGITGLAFRVLDGDIRFDKAVIEAGAIISDLPEIKTADDIMMQTIADNTKQRGTSAL